MGGGQADKPAPPASLDLDSTAFLFDYDGVLADIVDDPREARPFQQVIECLQMLQAAAGGAVAVISGREIATLDDMLQPLKLPAAGIHGLQHRDAGGIVKEPQLDSGKVDKVQQRLEDFARSREGLMVERKTASVALHYRRRPELADECRELVEQIAAEDDALRLLAGKMVFELKIGHRTKGDAIEDFMKEAPFRGRRPVFVGDDVTDEDGFAVLPKWDGISIKVGPGQTAARFRVPDTAQFRFWLKRLCTRAGAEAR